MLRSAREEPRSTRLTGLAGRLLLAWESPGWSGLLALLVYAALAARHQPGLTASEYPYFNYLADAFLHGQLSLRLLPQNLHDLVQYGGNVYLYWPPLPAVLLMPFVALFGVGFSDTLFTVGLGAVNVTLAALLLRQVSARLIPLNAVERGLLVLFFALGTVHFPLAVRGRVWFTGQLVGVMFVLLAYYAALRLRGAQAFFFTGAAIGAAALARNPLLFAGIWPAYFLLREHWNEGPRRLLPKLAAALAPAAALLLLLAAYNWARFGSPLEMGLDYHSMASRFRLEYQQYGAFHLHYLPTNLYYQLIYYPLPVNENTFMGGSLFLLSPLFFTAFWAFASPLARRSAAVLLLTILIINIPILLLMGTGWVTFGPRYTLDFTVPLLLLTAAGLKRWPPALIGLALFISLAHYTFGAWIELP